ncbi:hypothetical protein CMV_010898 [Castanea mollissima]|uniref:BED-type domain-containing protein n=1 Tax=Castanea mollissima TaxID=60419 RepID=A0A8J4R388_9ROSI|nr:hypothetical protein CMV_010898 [Castanea mollissima]
MSNAFFLKLQIHPKEVNKMQRSEISACSMIQSEETSALPTSTKRKSPSTVWNHFKQVKDDDGKVWAICERCGNRFSGSSKKGTSHLNNHLKTKKCLAAKIGESHKEMMSSSKTGDIENPTVTSGNFMFDEERSGLDLVRMIIKNGYSLKMVEHEDFKNFVKNLQPLFKLPSQDTLKDKIFRAYREEKERLLKQIDKVLSFSLILNFWTGHGKKNKYCSFTLQFIEDGLKLKKNTIALKEVEYNYTGEALSEIVKCLLLDLNIDKKLGSITVESSSANDQMVEIIKLWLGDQGNYHPFRGKIFHIPCIMHIINLLVQDGLDEIDYILPKIRKAIKYISETTFGKQKFEEAVKKLNLGGKNITFEGVPPRWDSTFFMLQIALELREAFVGLQSSDCDLSMEEWDKTEVMRKCLKVFYESKCRFLGSNCLTVFDPRTNWNFLHFSFEALYDMWNKAQRGSQTTELDLYYQEPRFRSEGEFDILGWWQTKGQNFPTLRTMACDILAIPMSTSISNSAFCIETRTINPIFNGLDDPDIIEALVCGKDWLDNPITITPNKDNEHSLELTQTSFVLAGSSISLESKEKHAPSIANTEVMLANHSSSARLEPLPTSIVSKSSDHGSSVNDAELLSRITTMEKKLEAEKVDREKERARYEAQLAKKDLKYIVDTVDLQNQIDDLVSRHNILNQQLNLFPVPNTPIHESDIGESLWSC